MSDNNKIETKKKTVQFGDWLVSRGVIEPRHLEEALTEQKVNGGKLGEVLVRLKKISDDQLASCLGEYLEIDSVNLDDFSSINMDVARSVPENISKRFCLVAIGQDDKRTVVAMADPLDVTALDTLTIKLKCKIKAVIASAGQIKKAIEAIYHGSEVEEKMLRDLVELEVSAEEGSDLIEESVDESMMAAEAEADEAPVIRFVDLMLSHAVKSRASDIHIEPQEKRMMIRMRVDGSLVEMVPPNNKMQGAIVARIKILSHMNIAEHRLPQDGRFKIRAPGRDIDVRVNVIPTIYGEKVVLRILDSASVDHDINKLGFEPELLVKFKEIIKEPHGILIVTGPTGSGKSTTLYSALNFLKDPRKNITTVEDPVEYRLGGINQIQIRPEIGLDFASSLRAILRQDPDIILLGEIRDKETMEIAIKASLTGHLVLSTFHTNDAPSAVSRLVYMGLERFLVASTINLVVAQRLVKKICDKCKEEIKLDEKTVSRFHLNDKVLEKMTFYQGTGCEKCNQTGYHGRLPIFEFLVFDRELRERIYSGASEAQIREYRLNKGYGSLFESGITKMMQGLTTAEEVLNVTYCSGDDVCEQAMEKAKE